MRDRPVIETNQYSQDVLVMLRQNLPVDDPKIYEVKESDWIFEEHDLDEYWT